MESSYNILPECYPYLNDTTGTLCLVTATDVNYAITSQEIIIKKFSPIFDRQIKRMEGEKFHVFMTEDTKLFCVRAPEQFTYRDKLKTELELLHKQGITAPATEPTEWCTPIVFTLKEDKNVIKMCVDLFTKRDI